MRLGIVAAAPLASRSNEVKEIRSSGEETVKERTSTISTTPSNTIGISMLRIFMYMCNHEVVFAALTSVLSHKNGAARSG